MAKAKEEVGSTPTGASEPLLWADEWMDRQPFDASQQALRTAFVRHQLRHAHVRRTADAWAQRYTQFAAASPQ